MSDPRSASDRISGSAMVLVVGLIADITAAAFFLVSSDTRSWLKSHYLFVAVTALLLTAGVLALLNMVLSLRGELRSARDELQARLSSPTEHDMEMFRAVNGYASPQSHMIIWLREGFLVSRAEDRQVRDLENMVLFFEREPRGFDDHEIHSAYREFLQSARLLLNKISEHMWLEGRTGWLNIPPEWDATQPERRDRAMQEIGEAHDQFMQSYDAFFLALQQKRFTSTIATPANSPLI